MKIYVHLWSYHARLFLEWEMCQTKFVQKIKTRISCLSNIFFFKSCRLWDNVEKYCKNRIGHRRQYGACALHAGYLRLQTHTRNMYYLYYLLLFHRNKFCTNVPLSYVIVHCVSCISIRHFCYMLRHILSIFREVLLLQPSQHKQPLSTKWQTWTTSIVDVCVHFNT